MEDEMLFLDLVSGFVNDTRVLVEGNKDRALITIAVDKINSDKALVGYSGSQRSLIKLFLVLLTHEDFREIVEPAIEILLKKEEK